MAQKKVSRCKNCSATLEPTSNAKALAESKDQEVAEETLPVHETTFPPSDDSKEWQSVSDESADEDDEVDEDEDETTRYPLKRKLTMSKRIKSFIAVSMRKLHKSSTPMNKSQPPLEESKEWATFSEEPSGSIPCADEESKDTEEEEEEEPAKHPLKRRLTLTKRIKAVVMVRKEALHKERTHRMTNNLQKELESDIKKGKQVPPKAPLGDVIENSGLIDDFLAKEEHTKKKILALLTECRTAVGEQKVHVCRALKELHERELKLEEVQHDLDNFHKVEHWTYKKYLMNAKSYDTSKSLKAMDKYRKKSMEYAIKIKMLQEKLTPKATKNRYVWTALSLCVFILCVSTSF